VRNAVRHTLLACGAMNLRRSSGGLYFVPREIPGTGDKATEGTPSLPILKGLEAVAEALYGERGDVHTIPCVNGEGERKMLRKHVALNIKEQAAQAAQKAFARVRESMSDRAPRQDFVTNLLNERRLIMQSLAHFQELVELEGSDVKQSLAELDKALEELQNLAEAA
jgi:ABC-type Na+ transport system ATPase subunit NatA